MKDDRTTAFERLEAAIAVQREWLMNDDPTAPIPEMHEVVQAFDAWKVAREAEPAAPEPAPPASKDERAMAERWARAYEGDAAWLKIMLKDDGGRESRIAAMLPLVREARAGRAPLAEAFCAVWPMYDDGPER